MKDELPNKLSKLIRLAVADAQKAKRSGAKLIGDEWVKKNENGKCSVCLAGAVMLKTLGDPYSDEVGSVFGAEPESYEGGNLMWKLRYLEEVRSSDMVTSLTECWYDEKDYSTLPWSTKRLTSKQMEAIGKANEYIKKDILNSEKDVDMYIAPLRVYSHAAKILESAGL